MVLSQWQSIMYKDAVSFYREVIDLQGNTLGYRLVSGPYACNYHRTPNYDVHSSDAGSSKEDNIFTVNKITLIYDAVVQPLDLALITDRHGGTDWQSIKGAPQQRQVLNYMMIYTVPTNTPVVVII